MSFLANQKEQVRDRRSLFEAAHRVVIKVGSAVLTTIDGVNLDVVKNISREIKYLHECGKEVILVSSGAVAAGRKKLNFHDESDISLREKQALAAVGQSHLMHIYDTAFEEHGLKIAQVLLTHSDLAHRTRCVNLKNTIFSLLKMNVIPIINENDTVSTEELQFGDNDNLAALVTNLVEGDLFICLTDVDCLYTANPVNDENAQPVYTVEVIDETIVKMAGNTKSILGTGGMQSKIEAAKKVSAGGGASLIGPGRMPNVLRKLFQGEEVGTFFMPQGRRLQGRKQWIAFVLKPKGSIELDQGACTALCSGGKSLLPSGVTAVKGGFSAGDSVQCCDAAGNVIGVGLTNYRSEDVQRIKGIRSDCIEQVLGYRDSDVLIHRDNLVIL